MANILDGRTIAIKIRKEIKRDIEGIKAERGIIPGLSFITVGDDPASMIYVRTKRKACMEVGIYSEEHNLPKDASKEEIISLIERMNEKRNIHGILLQLPLPPPLNPDEIIRFINPGKDVDGFHPVNIGRMFMGSNAIKPCTPLGIMKLLESTGIDLEGKDVVIVGAGIVVGKPLASLLLDRMATVTVCHIKTRDLREKVSTGEIVISAAGKMGLIKGEWIKEGAIVIDAGQIRTEDGRIVGDVEFDTASRRASFITPVPGGVGPMTVAMLLKNTLLCMKNLEGIVDREGE